MLSLQELYRVCGWGTSLSNVFTPNLFTKDTERNSTSVLPIKCYVPTFVKRNNAARALTVSVSTSAGLCRTRGIPQSCAHELSSCILSGEGCVLGTKSQLYRKKKRKKKESHIGGTIYILTNCTHEKWWLGITAHSMVIMRQWSHPTIKQKENKNNMQMGWREMLKMDLPELMNTTCNLDFDGKRTILPMAQWAVYNYILTVIRWHIIRHVRMPQQPVKQ